MTTKRLEIVQVMRAFACVSIFLYHLPVAWGGVKSNYSGFSLVVFFIFTGYFLMEGTRKKRKVLFQKKSHSPCAIILDAYDCIVFDITCYAWD